jgi:hypothetical protein
MPRPGTVSINFFPPKLHLQKPRIVVGSPVRGWATTEAAESLKAQLRSQSKLTPLRRETRKFLHENEI